MTCPRCHRELVPLEQLATLATCVDEHRLRLRRSFDRMRLSVPQQFTLALHDLDKTTPQLRAALACHTGVCTPQVVAGDAQGVNGG